MDIAAVIIASISALFSLGSLAVSYWTARRDRAKLLVRPMYSVGLHEPPVLGLDVTNVGYRPTTLVEAGYEATFKDAMTILKKKDSERDPKLITFSTHIILGKGLMPLKPGEMKEFRLVLNQWPNRMIPADAPLRPYVKDSTGKITRMAPQPFLRHIVKTNNGAPAGTPPELLEHRTIEAARIHPRWMFWKRK